MMLAYATVFAFLVLAAAFAIGSLLAAFLVRPGVPDPLKDTTYECGIEPTGGTESKINIRFYVYALLFVLFDVEIAFIYPWAVTVRELGPAALVAMMVFLGILFLGLVYAWGKGALAWDAPGGPYAPGTAGSGRAPAAPARRERTSWE